MTYRCPGCGAELARSGWVWVPIVLMALLAPGVAAALMVGGWGLPATIAVGLACVPLGTLIVKVVGYNLIPWRAKHRM